MLIISVLTGEPTSEGDRAKSDQQSVEIVAAEQAGICDGYTFLFDPGAPPSVATLSVFFFLYKY